MMNLAELNDCLHSLHWNEQIENVWVTLILEGQEDLSSKLSVGKW